MSIIWRGVLRCGMAMYCGTLAITKFLVRFRGGVRPEVEILLTGTFYSENWLIPHLQPLALSEKCRRVIMVATSPVPRLEKVEAVYPPKWLQATIGKVPARLLIFFWLGITRRPDFVGGFHLLLNGLVALMLGRLVRRRVLYLCGGGPREVEGGGYATDNRLFGKLGKPDQSIEKRLLKAVDACDVVVTMGTSAMKYFRDRGVTAPAIYVIPGGYDGDRFSPRRGEVQFDFVLVGRLSPVKCVDIFLKALKSVKNRRGVVSAAVVGDGPSRAMLQGISEELGLGTSVVFAGHQDGVEQWLNKARVFVLTSSSEGVSQAMIQAMLCGLPVVVPDVGDLGDIVRNGVNGYLISERGNPEAYALRMTELLEDMSGFGKFRSAARTTVAELEIRAVAEDWTQVLSNSG